MTMSELLLNVTDLHAGYGRAEVLHGLNLVARAGSVVTVIGPNGAGKSTLLLLDEPAAGLRLKEKQGLADVLRQLRDEGLSILLVEHDMDLVMGLVDRIVVMEFGTKLIEGTPEEVQASPAVRAAYLGTEH